MVTSQKYLSIIKRNGSKTGLGSALGNPKAAWQWVTFVDVETRNIWNVYNGIRYLDGSLHLEHDIRTIGRRFDGVTLSELNILGEEYRTDFDGLYSIADEDVAEDTPLTVWLRWSSYSGV